MERKKLSDALARSVRADKTRDLRGFVSFRSKKDGKVIFSVHVDDFYDADGNRFECDIRFRED